VLETGLTGQWVSNPWEMGVWIRLGQEEVWRLLSRTSNQLTLRILKIMNHRIIIIYFGQYHSPKDVCCYKEQGCYWHGIGRNEMCETFCSTRDRSIQWKWTLSQISIEPRGEHSCRAQLSLMGDFLITSSDSKNWVETVTES
jgi:hypothetical protein